MEASPSAFHLRPRASGSTQPPPLVVVFQSFWAGDTFVDLFFSSLLSRSGGRVVFTQPASKQPNSNLKFTALDSAVKSKVTISDTLVFRNRRGADSAGDRQRSALAHGLPNFGNYRLALRWFATRSRNSSSNPSLIHVLAQNQDANVPIDGSRIEHCLLERKRNSGGFTKKLADNHSESNAPLYNLRQCIWFNASNQLNTAVHWIVPCTIRSTSGNIIAPARYAAGVSSVPVPNVDKSGHQTSVVLWLSIVQGVILTARHYITLATGMIFGPDTTGTILIWGTEAKAHNSENDREVKCVQVGQSMLSARLCVNSSEGGNMGIRSVGKTGVSRGGDGHEQRRRLNAAAYKSWDQNGAMSFHVEMEIQVWYI
ncbi:hypothetical protein C8R44DRAFT_733897 [Mycena epipterygia]|nr:hypothetical protein C8R44DRAFT_733897 [Mycena epipterygia]